MLFQALGRVQIFPDSLWDTFNDLNDPATIHMGWICDHHAVSLPHHQSCATVEGFEFIVSGTLGPHGRKILEFKNISKTRIERNVCGLVFYV